MNTNNYMSYFEAPISNNNPIGDILLNELAQKIKFDEEIKSNTMLVQSMDEKKTRDLLKCKLLPSVTSSGKFSYRNFDGFIRHSGLMCLDIDKISDKNQLETIKNNLLTDKEIGTLLLFVSPSGSGLKWFIKIPPVKNTHLMYFLAVENYLNTVYKIIVDTSGKDVTRKCLVGHDPSAFIADITSVNELNQSFLEKWLPIQERVTNKEFDNTDVEEKIQRLSALVSKIMEMNISIAESYENWHLIGFSLAEIGERGRDFFHILSKASKKYNVSESDEKFTSLLNDYNGSVTLGTLYYLAKQFGIDIKSSAKAEIKNNEYAVSDSYSKKLRALPDRLNDAKNLPKMTRLLGNIWCKGEVHILFGDNGTGKSIWATQIAEALTKGKSTFCNLPNQSGVQNVLFYDFELSDTQIVDRYSDSNGNIHQFAPNLIHDNLEFNDPYFTNSKEKIDHLIIKKIKKDIIEYKPDILIIDNITYLRTEATQDANVALELIRALIDFKKTFGLSILILAHTPKIKHGYPITNNDLAGSKNLSNLVDSISAIGVSAEDNSVKYIKSIKCRSTEKEFDTGNVILVKQEKEGSFLKFTYLGQGNEYDLIRDPLKVKDDEIKENLKREIINLNNAGKSYREIEELTGISKSKIGRIIQEYQIDDNILL